ncbi:lipid-A-disaccharide synthase-related protein [cf. Phormidesmis sp. LEGE 11477]|uniref:lipid-A-disaccharide synthase-related protein n=1 Tax=cf. Phormidesmis sp. LEGE 11477 TaxID=1828680 RepID=UPI00188072F3|nr:lipid-A-disaccharide synthase-related protein [cf. Phormidesmis sp. LEGE 11477]MBE9060755.1 hypothetical protein [cf. Phormidesmis sp. LEGE 11477]
MKLLCISNGHGEDVIAVRILSAIRQQNPAINLYALPISGEGSTYHRANIPIIGKARILPSGGFLNRDPQQLAKDMSGGLIALTKSQISALKTWAKTSSPETFSPETSSSESCYNRHILAVGDIVPLLFAYYSGLSYSFVGTAKSEYWLRDESGKHPSRGLWSRFEGWSGSIYLPWERWLMSQHRCRNIFVRDEFTADHLSKRGLAAQYAGNPMMDNLSPAGALPQLPQEQNPTTLNVLLLPGSRQPEAYENWSRILATLPSLIKALPYRTLVLLGAIAPSLSHQKLIDSLPTEWTVTDSTPVTYQHQNATLLLTSAYSDCLHTADIAIATAGTATEQFVGLGKPAITLPGKGPQFTKAFATVQAKMLGPSIQIVEEVNAVGSAIAQLIQDPERLQLIDQNGKHRMGKPGAGKRIATKVLATMNDQH